MHIYSTYKLTMLAVEASMSVNLNLFPEACLVVKKFFTTYIVKNGKIIIHMKKNSLPAENRKSQNGTL